MSYLKGCSMTNRLKRKTIRRNTTGVRERLSQGSSRATSGSGKSWKRVVREHQDVLQNIEFALVAEYRNDRTIDDCIIAEVLKSAIHNNAPTDDRAQSLDRGLREIRQLRSDVPDDVWRDCLRTILQSVRLHSSLKQGSKGYLNFVSDYIL